MSNNGHSPTWVNVRVKLGDLRPWQLNPRHITRKQALRLAESFDEFGQVETIAVGPDLDVYNGHQRLSVLHKLHGPDFEIDARQASRPLTDEERRKLVVYLHAGAVGDWDWDALSGWDASNLMQWGFDGDLLGDWKRDIAALGNLLESEMPEPQDAEPQIDRAAELLEKWQVKMGDLLRIGEHRLLCGDSTKREDVERVMQGERANATVTDLPYGVGVDYGSFEDTPENVKKLIAAVMPIIFDNLPAALTPGIPVMWDYPRPSWVGAWIHPAPSGGCPWGFVGNNPILFYGNDPYLKIGMGRRPDSVVMGTDRQGEVNHPTPKPIRVWEWLVVRMTPKSDAIVFDPFVGSGTTIVACQNLGRKCRAIEISPAYCAVTLERMATAFPGIEIERITSQVDEITTG